MKISIITAVFNRANTIGHTIRSVQEQNYQCFEHIIQDGASSDGTLDIINEMKSHSISLISEPDAGIYDAINRGILRAKGDVIGLMHSDDFFANRNVLKNVADAFSDPSIDGVYGDLQYVSANDPTRVIRYWRAGEFKLSALSRGWMPPHPTMYLRRRIYEQLGGYDTSFQISADYDAILRYLTSGQVRLAYIPEVLVKMRVGGESNRSLKKIITKSLEDIRAIRNNEVGGINTLINKNFRKLNQFFSF